MEEISEQEARQLYGELNKSFQQRFWTHKDYSAVSALYQQIDALNSSYPQDSFVQELRTLEKNILHKKMHLQYEKHRVLVRKALAAVLGTFLGTSSLLYWFEPAERVLVKHLPALERLLEMVEE